MEIRRAEHSDIEALLPLVADYCLADDHVFNSDGVRYALSVLCESDTHGTAWVMEDAGELVGYVTVAWSFSLEIYGREAVLDEVFIADRHRNKGYGRALLERVLEDCRSRSMKRVFLETEAPNVLAREVYSRLGFERQDSIWMSIDFIDD
ncbi:MAG: GNAT family N-acetyltransferase [Acidimicrobiia bacterium]